MVVFVLRSLRSDNIDDWALAAVVVVTFLVVVVVCYRKRSVLYWCSMFDAEASLRNTVCD